LTINTQKVFKKDKIIFIYSCKCSYFMYASI